MKEWTAKPLVSTKNGATVVATFPCIIICGVSNYCDTHDQSYWGDYAAFKAEQYVKKTGLSSMIVKLRVPTGD
jgi:hypothetical protein